MKKSSSLIGQALGILAFALIFLLAVDTEAFIFGRKSKEKAEQKKETKTEVKIEAPKEFKGAPEPPPLGPLETPEPAVEPEPEEAAPAEQASQKPSTLQETRPVLFPKSKTWNFDDEKAGNESAEFFTFSTTQTLGSWLVFEDSSAPSAENVLAQVDSTTEKERISYNILFPYQNENLKIQFKVKAVSGELAKGGGVVFRYQNPENHYLVFVNVGEKALSFERVVKGVRESLMRSPAPLDENKWHSIEIVTQGPRFITFLDGAPYLNQTDGTFAHGWAGFFTERDAVTYFDDLSIEDLTS